MFQQVVSVIAPFLPLYIIFISDVCVAALEVHAELVDGFRIMYMGLCLKKVSGKLFIYGHGYPPLSEIKVKEFEADRFRYGCPQDFQ